MVWVEKRTLCEGKFDDYIDKALLTIVADIDFYRIIDLGSAQHHTNDKFGQYGEWTLL